MKSHGHFWNGSGAASHFPREPETGTESLFAQKTKGLPAMEIYFPTQNSQPTGLTLGTECLKL